jgi:hypothetical protein
MKLAKMWVYRLIEIQSVLYCVNYVSYNFTREEVEAVDVDVVTKYSLDGDQPAHSTHVSWQLNLYHWGIWYKNANFVQPNKKDHLKITGIILLQLWWS